MGILNTTRIKGRRFFSALAFVSFTCAPLMGQEITGLAGWNIYFDPGHSRIENMGVYGYSEAQKNLAVAQNLHDLFMTKTDIDTVYLSRDSQDDYITLGDRSADANTLGAQWFHSIHSDATSDPTTTANSVLMLWGQYSNGTEKQPPGGQRMSKIMAPTLAKGMRTSPWSDWGDCTFYGCTSGGPYLSVNRNTTMPSELSESGFHTNPMQNQRNMNAHWKRMEAYTFFWSILRDHGITRPQVRILNGILYDLESNIPVNGAAVAAGGITDTTDSHASLFHQYSTDPNKLHNGYYWLEDVAGDTVELVVSAPGYYPDTVQVAMVDTFFTFRDMHLISSMPPVVVSSTPTEGDTAFPAWNPLVINFSRPMEPSSVETGFAAPGGMEGTFTWRDDNRIMEYLPDSLVFLTGYSFTISGDAQDTYGHFFDGNGDGTGGDSLTVTFRTGPQDMFPPAIVTTFPRAVSRDHQLQPLINIEFDEEIDGNSVSEGMVRLVYMANQYQVPGTLEHYVVNDRSVLNFFTGEQLEADRRYSVSVQPGLRDLLGNEQTGTPAFVFNTGDHYYLPTTIDNFENGVGNFEKPTYSGSTVGYLVDHIRYGADTEIVNRLTNSTQAMRLSYGWDTTATSGWLLREYLSGGSARDVRFNSSYTLQAYVFGDGSGNLFRFAVDDDLPNATAADHEVSPWYTIDWIGWRLVSWDMSLGETGTWVGDGILNGTMRFDSFQLSYGGGEVVIDSIYFDDLRIARSVGLAVAGRIEPIPEQFALQANYPNPFNPSTIIPYDVPRPAELRLVIYNLLGQPVRTLFTGQILPGHYQAVWDGKDNYGRPAASGIYIYSLQTEGTVISRKMVLTK
ncbi:Ig-like domain-containing protein [Candidatus Neomarinimicrobiota bacterium]